MAQPSKSESVPFQSEKEKVKTVDGMKPNRGQVEDERFFRIFNITIVIWRLVACRAVA